MRELNREQKNVRPVREASALDDFRAIQRTGHAKTAGFQESNWRTYSSGSGPTIDDPNGVDWLDVVADYYDALAPESNPSAVWTDNDQVMVFNSDNELVADKEAYSLQEAQTFANKTLQKLYKGEAMVPKGQGKFFTTPGVGKLFGERQAAARKQAGLDHWDGYPGEGFWDLATASGGWSANIMDLGDPALSMGMFDNRFTWTVTDHTGAEKASGVSDLLSQAAEDAEVAYLMVSDPDLSLVSSLHEGYGGELANWTDLDENTRKSDRGTLQFKGADGKWYNHTAEGDKSVRCGKFDDRRVGLSYSNGEKSCPGCKAKVTGLFDGRYAKKKTANASDDFATWAGDNYANKSVYPAWPRDALFEYVCDMEERRRPLSDGALEELEWYFGVPIFDNDIDAAKKTSGEHWNDSGFDQSAATDAAFDVIEWLEETTPAGSYTYNGHGVPVDMNLDKLVQDWAAATGKGQVSFVALQGLNELLNDDQNRYSKRKTAYSDHMKKYEAWCEDQHLRWDSEASLYEYKMKAEISSRNWDRLFKEVTEDEAFQYSAAKTAGTYGRWTIDGMTDEEVKATVERINGLGGGVEPVLMSKRKTASMWDSVSTASRHKVAGWDWDERLSGYVAEGSSLHFACICGANVEAPGYTNCVCGKRWNSYPIVAEGSSRLVCREIPVRDVVLARKATPPAR